MPRMIDLIRVSALPSNLMHSASKGSLQVPGDEMIEILVHLATKNQLFGQQARMTLAAWDEAGSRAAAANPKTAKEVLDYFISPQNLRPALLPALLENPSVREGALVELAASSSREVIETMQKSGRVKRSPRILEALKQSPHATSHPPAPVEEKLAAVQAPPGSPVIESAADPANAPAPTEFAVQPEESTASEVMVESDDVLNASVKTYLDEHSAEIAAEGNKPFEPVGAIHEDLDLDPEPEPTAEEAATVKRAAVFKKAQGDMEERRGSVLQKIAKMDVKERIQLAMKGNKEERSILIRDGTKLVSLGVLESPKITDGEVERFASQKNVQEAVLRGIAMKRRFIKLYPVIRNLVSNPRTPMDLALGLMKHLLVQDLKNLSANKDVSDTVRKLALKNFKQKTETKK
jgi:hypothetical protein